MIDHITLKVKNFPVAREFYKAVLKPLGYSLLMEFENSRGGFGIGGKIDFWIAEENPTHLVHVAFSCPDRKIVDDFYSSAIEAGAKDNGPPGIRPKYHPNYYGAFILDPDGNNIEAVCHH